MVYVTKMVLVDLLIMCQWTIWNNLNCACYGICNDIDDLWTNLGCSGDVTVYHMLCLSNEAVRSDQAIALQQLLPSNSDVSTPSLRSEIHPRCKSARIKAKRSKTIKELWTPLIINLSNSSSRIYLPFIQLT